MKSLIKWGVGSAWNFGFIEGTDVRIERMRTMDKKLMFLISDDNFTYLHCDSQRFHSQEDLDAGIIAWAIRAGKVEYLH